jgi:sarcosine oxidase delta subunit
MNNKAIIKKRNQATLREVENSDFILYQQSQMSSHSNFWAPNNECRRFLKGSAGHQVTRNLLIVNR